MAYLRDRRAFGNIGTRKFRGARFGDPLSPRGPQYTKEGLILDYSTDVGPFTIIDQSGQDNTATLYSGRGLTMDAVNDTVTYATGYSSASRTATLWGKFNTTSPVALLGSVSGSFIFTPTATGVWEELTSTATVEGDLAWDLGLDFDIGDLTCATEHWTHNDWSDPTADGLNGKTIVDSGANQLHGTCTGCSGFTGEATIPQTADKNWNKYQWFNGTDTYVETTGMTAVADYFGSCTISANLVVASNTTNNAVWSLGGSAYKLWIGAGGNWMLGNSMNTLVSVSLGSQSVSVDYDSSGNATSLSINGTEVWTGSAAGTVAGTSFYVGARLSGSVGLVFHGIIYDFAISGSSVKNFAYTGLGTSVTAWEDTTIGSNNGTESGTFTRELVSASDANDQIDALGTAILEPRRNTQQLNLFGEGEYSSTPDSDSLDVTTEATWELWGNFYGVPATSNYLFAKWDFVDGQNRAWAIIKNPAGLDSDLVMLWGDPSTGVAVGSSIISIADKVSHIAFTYAAGTVVAYVDGVSVSITGSAAPASLFQSSIPVTINATGSTVADRFWDRKIGSAKIYNRALTAEEVLTNYESQKSLYLNVFPFTLT